MPRSIAVCGRTRYPTHPGPKPSRALDDAERQAVIDALHSERFRNQAPSQVYATLLDEGTYLCSVRTLYRILNQVGEVRERRDQLRYPNYTEPELVATSPISALPTLAAWEALLVAEINCVSYHERFG